MTTDITTRLWEVDHPYYCQEGTDVQGTRATTHTRFLSWDDFKWNSYYVRGDSAQNFLVRWDWHKSGFRVGGLDCRGPERLVLFFVLQRRALLCSVEVPVTEADEPVVREFLARCAKTMRATWEPVLDLPTP